MADLSRYHPTTNLEWIDRYITSMGAEEFEAFEQRVNAKLAQLRVGQFYDITKVPENLQELYIKLCGTWILHHNNYDLLDNCTKIYRREKEPYIYTKESNHD